MMPHNYRDPSRGPDAEAKAKATFKTLCKIAQVAAESVEYGRHEHAWNSLVHQRIFEQVFTSNILGATPVIYAASVQTSVSVRCEPVMSATIEGTSIPHYQNSPGDSSIYLACSVSKLSDGHTASSSYTSSYSMGTGNVSVSELETRRQSKKVDYVLVMDTAQDGSLHQTISELINHVSSIRNVAPHVNQTSYQPLKYSPIAVSIETKTQYTSIKAHREG
jgi:hypothetical protein